MDVNGLLVVLSGFLAVVLEYFPVLRDRFGKLTAWEKRVIVGALLFVVALAIRLADCPEGFGRCGVDLDGAWGLLRDVLVAVGVNQGTHRLVKQN